LTRFTANDPSVAANDFFRTVIHEMGHAMGIAFDSRFSFFSDLTDTGFTDPNDGSAEVYVFNAGSGNVTTITTNGGGHVFEGPQVGTFPFSPNDLMNAGRTVPLSVDRRQLITDTD